MEVSVAVGLLCRRGSVLLGKRSAHRKVYPGVWDLPGGHVELGETAEQALVRELREEIGVTPTAWREFAVLSAPAMAEAMADNSNGMLRLWVFLVTAWNGEPRNLQPDEHDTIAWLPADDAARLTLAYPGYVKLFRYALQAAS